jgi:Matrixin/FG-GAP-like repeat
VLNQPVTKSRKKCLISQRIFAQTAPRLRQVAKHKVLASLIVGFFAAISAGRLDAFVLEGQRWPAGSVVPLQFSLGPAQAILSDGNTTWDGAAKSAVDPWNQVMSRLQLQVNLSPAFLFGPPLVSGDGLNYIVFADTIFGQSFPVGVVAVTVRRFTGSTMREADILFNNAETFDSYHGLLRFEQDGTLVNDIHRVLIHELGHVIGLDHPDTHGQNVAAIMNSIESDRDTLSRDDIAGAQFLYGAPAQKEAPNRSDFNNDGFPDYVLVNNITGQTAIWHLQIATLLNGVYGPSLPGGWILARVADMNGDGYTDFVLVNPTTRQTAIWYLNDAALILRAMGPTLPPGWTLSAAADFNGDGQRDYVLSNETTGQTTIWFLNGTAYTGNANAPALPLGWVLTEANDMNGDGKPDFILFNPNTRQTALWYLNGTTLAQSALGPPLPTGWTLGGAVDVDRDGQLDYLLFNENTHQTAIWLLNGANLNRGLYGPTLPFNYNLVAP